MKKKKSRSKGGECGGATNSSSQTVAADDNVDLGNSLMNSLSVVKDGVVSDIE